MTRPTDFERGARLALYLADVNLIPLELFPLDAEHVALWSGIRDAAQDALVEAVTCRQLVGA